MPRMIDLIRQSAVPANLVRTASKGALNLPPAEMIEILVYLTTTPLFAEQARLSLAAWDEAASIAVASDPHTPWEVLSYMIAPANLRPKLLPALLENPSIREAALVELAQLCARDVVEIMLRSPRVLRSPELLQTLLANPHLRPDESERLNQALAASGVAAGAAAPGESVAAAAAAAEQAKTQYEIEHAAEIAAEEAAAKPFQLIGGYDADDLALESVQPTLEPETGLPGDVMAAGDHPPAVLAPEAAPPDAAAAAADLSPAAEAASPAAAVLPPMAEAASPAAAAAPAAVDAPAPTAEEAAKSKRAAEAVARERSSALQRIARMSVSQRIQLAMKGSKEERFILVRDGSRLVSQAVLNSPKVSDQEIEMFASMKNVQEGVLREIARSHKFMKNYGVVRQLVNNPRCPLDISLTLMGHLQIGDLKSLSANKNIPETLRKLAFKRFKDKTEKKPG